MGSRQKEAGGVRYIILVGLSENNANMCVLPPRSSNLSAELGLGHVQLE